MKAFSKGFVILFSGAIALMQFSCKKTSISQPVTISLAFSDKALEYVKLTEGKYLIFKNSSNAAEDSVVITKSYVDNILTGEVVTTGINIPAYYHERCKLTLSKFTGSSSSEWLSGIADIPFSYFSTDSSDMQMFDENGVGMSMFNFFGSTLPILAMTVEGRTFNNVLETIADNGWDISNPLYKKNTTYWAKGIGIIKREVVITGGVSKTYALLRNN